MADANDHARTVLAAIIPDRRDLLDRALRDLVPTHFLDPTLRNIFTLLERYLEVTGSVLSRGALEDLLRNTDEGRRALYTEIYDSLWDRRVEDPDFIWSLTQLKSLAAERLTGEVLTQSMEILRTGVTDRRGREQRGHEAARTHVMTRFSEIDRDLNRQDSPEGDMREEGQDMLADYEHRRHLHTSGAAQGVRFGVPALDTRVGGLQPGELDLIAGYSSDGKTSLCVQAAWSAVVEQGKNTVILTTETLRPQVRRKIISRHSRFPQFDLPEGFNSRDLKNGTLPESQWGKFQEVVSDFTRNPTYGRLYIAQVPRGASIATCEQTLYRVQRQFHVEFVVIDYLRLLVSSKKRDSDREELGAIIIEAKQLATTFDDGRGVPIVSPWQVNRTARDNAERAGFYTSAALAESAEATNTADVIVSILAPSDNDSRYAEVKAQILKNRDGETASNITLNVDYATSLFTSRQEASELDSLLLGDAGEPSVDSGVQFAGLLS